MSFLWIPAAFLASFTRAGSRLSNQYFQLPGIYLVIWTKVFLILYMIPFVLNVTWPTDPWFYGLLVLQAPFAVFKDKITFDMTAKHGSGAVTRVEPLIAPTIFLVWLVLNPDLLFLNLENPLRFAGIAASICFASYFAMRMRDCEISLATLKDMMPAIVSAALVSVIAKFCIDRAEHDNALFVYLFFQSIMMLMVAFLFDRKEQKDGFSLSMINIDLWKPMLVSLLSGLTVLTRMYGYRYAENPAYVNAIVLLSPFWVILFYKLVKHEEKGDVKSGIGIVVCSIVLTLLVVKG